MTVDAQELWTRLEQVTSWLNHVAKLNVPAGDANSAPIWQAIAEKNFATAMQLAEAAFQQAAEQNTPDGDIPEAMGLLCRLNGRHDLAESLFELAPPADCRIWRNRGVFALWARNWPLAALAFSRGLTATDPTSETQHHDRQWCQTGLALMQILARDWDAAHRTLETGQRGNHSQSVPHELAALTHLCRMAANWGRKGLSADLSPDIRLETLCTEKSTVFSRTAPNHGSGILDKDLAGDLILFLACDPKYLENYGLSAMASFAEAHPDRALSIHLHLYDPTDAARALAQRASTNLGSTLAITTEISPPHPTTNARGTYYACARFCRLAEAAPRYKAPVIALDADALIRRDCRPLIGRTPHIGMTFSPHTVPWNRYPAGFIVLQPTPEVRSFLTDVATMIGDSLTRGQRLWFLDQWALTIAASKHDKFRHGLRRYPWRWTYNTTFAANALVWQANDDRKYSAEVYTREALRLKQMATTEHPPA